MPRWRDLPDELDPRLREFAEQLRGVVDRAGLSVAAVADRTGYSRTSWERYLDGRLLAPKGAVVALAEVTGTPPGLLTALREPAERAWSRAQPRQDRAFGSPDAGTGPGGAGRGAGRRRLALFLAGVAGVVIVVVGAFLLTDAGPAPRAVGAGGPPSPSVRVSTVLPSGVRCSGSGCTGKDAEETGCGGDLATTAKSATVGTVQVEVRYSRTCGAAWGRITQAAPGDAVRVTVGSARRTGTLTRAGDTIAYTPMIAVRDATRATACAVLASGEEGCTR